MVAPGIDAWAAWPPRVLAVRLADVDTPWCVAADDADLRLVLPALDGARRAWLASALARVHPGHRWLEHVGEATAGG